MFVNVIFNFNKMIKFFVRIYRKIDTSEAWQTLGPYDFDIALEIMCEYLKKGECCWVEDIKYAE